MTDEALASAEDVLDKERLLCHMEIDRAQTVPTRDRFTAALDILSRGLRVETSVVSWTVRDAASDREA